MAIVCISFSMERGVGGAAQAGEEEIEHAFSVSD